MASANKEGNVKDAPPLPDTSKGQAPPENFFLRSAPTSPVQAAVQPNSAVSKTKVYPPPLVQAHRVCLSICLRKQTLIS